MKTTGARSFILYILGIGFLAGLGIFLYGYILNGGTWAVQPFNRHLSGSTSAVSGTITDRSGDVLAQTKDGQRVYSSDETTRRAMLHVLGDTLGYISTGVQYRYRAELSGYNLVTGLATPNGQSNGCDITLTLDSSLCRLAREKLGSRSGAVALYNYKTGQLLCMVSTPDYDPSNPPDDLNTDTTGKYSGVYVNKVLSSTLTPGSTFKVVTSAAAIESISDLDSRTWESNGSITINGNNVTDVQSYGTLSFKDALAKSSNVVFAQVGLEVGASKLTAMAEQMGFNHNFSLDGITTAASSYSVTGATDDELAWSAVGQYTDLANPFHMMVLMGAVANGGVPVMPYMVQNIVTSYGMTVKTGSGQNGSRMLSAETASRLAQYMRYDVTNHYGDSLFPNLKVCAKTGTAQVSGQGDNCWMVGFSTNENTPYAFAVVIENSTQNSLKSAGALASAVMQAAAQLK